MFELHFLRPEWLLSLPVLVLSYWCVRRRLRKRQHMQSAIAPHLVAALTPRQRLADKFKPVDLVLAIGCLLALAAAGPAWEREVSDRGAKAPIVLVQKVSESMLANDFQPSRLELAKQKIRDLLSFRAGAKTALIAYASTSHKVLPMTEDHRVFLPFIEALVPGVMPGNSVLADDAADALALAQQELERAGGGSVVLLADDIRASEVIKLKSQSLPFIWWQFATPEGGMIVSGAGDFVTDSAGQALSLKLNETIAGELAQMQTQKVALGNQDIVAIDRTASQQRRQALQGNTDAPYRDMGWYFCWPALVLVALWFRKGFTTAEGKKQRASVSGVCLLVCAAALLAPTPSARADAVDWFFTADQQGWMAFKNNQFDRSAELFLDPMWRGTALYENGKYELAAQVFATVGTLDAMYNRANALLKAHQYPQAIAAYEQVLAQEPGYEKAARNQAIAEQIMKLLIAEGGNIDAEQSVSLEVDDRTVKHVDDNTKTLDYQVGDNLSVDAKEQWMRSVNSDMSDFLSAKFSNEAAHQEQSP